MARVSQQGMSWLQVTQFRFQDDRKRALLSQLLQRKCITTALGVHWSHVEIRRTKGKKPWVVCDDVEKDHAPNFNFNVSHEVSRHAQIPIFDYFWRLLLMWQRGDALCGTVKF